MVIAIFVLRFLQHESGTILVGTCSLVITVACYALEEERNSSEIATCEQKLQWDVFNADKDGVKHGAFSIESIG